MAAVDVDREAVWKRLFFTQLSVFLLMCFVIPWGKTGFLAYYADNPGKLWIMLGIYCGFALIWALSQSMLYVFCCGAYTSIWAGFVTGTIGSLFFGYTFFLTCTARWNYWIGFSLYAIFAAVILRFWKKLRDGNFSRLLSAAFSVFCPLLLVVVWFFLHPQTPGELLLISQKLEVGNKFPSAQRYFAACAEKCRGKKYVHPQVEKILQYVKMDRAMYVILSFGAADKDIARSPDAVVSRAGQEGRNAAVPTAAAAVRPQPEEKKEVREKAAAARVRHTDRNVAGGTAASASPDQKKVPSPIEKISNGDPKTNVSSRKSPVDPRSSRPVPEKSFRVTRFDINLEQGLKFQITFIHPASQPVGEASASVSNEEKGGFSPRIKHSYGMSAFLVTQGQYEKVMGTNPSRRLEENAPVTDVSWEDANNFCKKLNKRYASVLPKGYVFSLPTEAQWQYACTAGSALPWNYGAGLPEDGNDSGLDKIAWYDKNSNGRPHAVGQKQPNNWGLYDMHGNVFEWCYDGCQETARGKDDAVILVPGPMKNDSDGTRGQGAGEGHIIRGGGYDDTPQYCRADARLGYRTSANFIGFRLAVVKKETR